MFGYVGTIESELKVREAASYKSWYCGLCKCMKRHYGPLSTLFLQYDCAFLALLFSGELGEKVDEIKANDGDNNTEQVAGALCKLPGLFLKFALWLINLLDYFDLLPQFVLDASPFHGSMIITDLGSLGVPPIYHHIYNFGNLSTFIAFGAKRKAYELDRTGAVVERKYIDYKVSMDERTVDGIYYANGLKYLKYYMKNPAALELPPEKVNEDVF